MIYIVDLYLCKYIALNKNVIVRSELKYLLYSVLTTYP